MPKPLTEARKGDPVILRDSDGSVADATHRVLKVTATEVTTRHEDHRGQGARFKIATGREVGGRGRVVELVTEAERDAARELIAAGEKRVREETGARNRAAYDALPEPVKLARSLLRHLDGSDDATNAGLPVEPLRELVEWFNDRRAAKK